MAQLGLSWGGLGCLNICVCSLCLGARWVLALLEDAGDVWHPVTGFCAHELCSLPWVRPKPAPAGVREP